MKILITFLLILSLGASAAEPLANITNPPEITDHTFRIFKLIEKLDPNKVIEDGLKKSGKFNQQAVTELKKIKTEFKVSRTSNGGISVDLFGNNKSLITFSLDKTLKEFSIMTPNLKIPKTFKMGDPNIEEKIEKSFKSTVVESSPKSNYIRNILNQLFINTSYAWETDESMRMKENLLAGFLCIITFVICIPVGVIGGIIYGLYLGIKKILDVFGGDLNCCELSEYGGEEYLEKDPERLNCERVSPSVLGKSTDPGRSWYYNYKDLIGIQVKSVTEALESHLYNDPEVDDRWKHLYLRTYNEEIGKLRGVLNLYAWDNSVNQIDEELLEFLNSKNYLTHARNAANQMMNYCEQPPLNSCKEKFIKVKHQVKKALDLELDALNCHLYKKKMGKELLLELEALPKINVNNSDRNQEIEKIRRIKENLNKIKSRSGAASHAQ